MLHLFQPEARLRAPNVVIRLQGVIAGLGVGLLATSYCREKLATGRILPLLPELVPEQARMYALQPARRLMPPKVRIFLEALDARLAEPAAPLPAAHRRR